MDKFSEAFLRSTSEPHVRPGIIVEVDCSPLAPPL
jgi:hypothetical protein